MGVDDDILLRVTSPVVVMKVTCVIPSSCASVNVARTAVQCYVVRCMSEEKDNRGLRRRRRREGLVNSADCLVLIDSPPSLH